MCYTVLYRYPLLWARAADRGGHEATGAMPAWKAVLLRQAGPIPVPAVPVPISTHPKKQYNLTTTVKLNTVSWCYPTCRCSKPHFQEAFTEYETQPNILGLVVPFGTLIISFYFFRFFANNYIFCTVLFKYSR